jgi:hypothetical protein
MIFGGRFAQLPGCHLPAPLAEAGDRPRLARPRERLIDLYEQSSCGLKIVVGLRPGGLPLGA